ncbi:MAG: sensor histidine kinase [Planctomycetes bacterium]|nr:sensor histidine kinase [Planctomycetota bacterium]NOG54985.1 HAMP domain-containing histidine kinase [Planctomycetota bacterium]
MSLQVKFILLLFLLGLAVVISVVFSGWSVLALDREATQTYRNLAFVLDRLDVAKQRFEQQIRILDPRLQSLHSALLPPGPDGQRSESGPDAAEHSPTPLPISEMEAVLDDLESLESLRERIGQTTSRALLSRGRKTIRAMTQAIAARNDGSSVEFASALGDAEFEFERFHLLAEQIEKRVLDDIKVALEHGKVIRGLVMRVLLGCLLGSMLVAVLGMLLLRRWVRDPIRRLRNATERLASGDFDYRIQVTSDDELGLLSAEVNEMASTILSMQQERVERERLAAVGEMTRRIVHNLRNPLAGIRGLAELTAAELPAEQDTAEYQRRILATVDRFEGWLKELLRTTSPMDAKPVLQNIAPTIQHVIEAHEAQALARSITVSVAVEQQAVSLVDLSSHSVDACFDPMHFEQALSALVGNAIEAVDERGQVRISLERNEDKRICIISVADDGPGIEPDHHDQIFEPYYSTKRHGTGIGLALVKNIVQAHHGRIALKRSEMGGAEFVITLPG